MRILGIETSCDETAAAIVEGEADGNGVMAVTLRSHVVYSQIALHAEFGGVVPELAGRAHIRHIQPVVAEAIQQSGIAVDRLDGIAVTAGPGLIGALLVGVCFAKGLALALQRPLLGIHHMEGHLLSPLLDRTQGGGMTFPFVALLVSGGHTLLVLAEAFGRYRLLGRSRDDAVGEAFDKGAKMLGLGYPGGPAIAALAESGNPAAFRFPRILLERGSLDFSFSGLKTALRTFLLTTDAMQKSAPSWLNDVAASYQEAIVETLMIKAMMACRTTGVARLVVAGGVGANQRLRHGLSVQAQREGVQLYFPPLWLCTDNGAMIAHAGLWRLLAGEAGDWGLDARARWPLADLAGVMAKEAMIDLK